MLKTTPGLSAAIANFNNETQISNIDIYTQEGFGVKINSESDWAGFSEPLKPVNYWARNGSNGALENNIVYEQASSYQISATDNSGFLQLEAGAEHAIAAGAQTGVGRNVNWSLVWAKSTNLKGDVATVTKVYSGSGGVSYNFVAQITQKIDSVNMYADITLALLASMRFTATIFHIEADGSTLSQVGRAAVSPSITASGIVEISGFEASLRIGESYVLSISYIIPTSEIIPPVFLYPGTSRTYSLAVSIFPIIKDVAAEWSVSVDTLGGFNMSGLSGFKSAGWAYRSMDMSATPLLDGVVSFSDVVPVTSSLVIDLYYTNDAALFAIGGLPTPIGADPNTQWVKLSAVSSGDVLPLHRYWRAGINMAATATNDDTPQLDFLEVRYRGLPLRISTIPQLGTYGAGLRFARSIPVLNSMSSIQAQVSADMKKSIVGGITAIVSPDSEINNIMLTDLKGSDADITTGFEGVDGELFVYSGTVDDVRWNSGRWELMIIDKVNLSNVDMPRDKAGDVWDATTTYAINDVITYNQHSWEALTINTGVTPVEGVDWTDKGTVWEDLIYTSATSGTGLDWHLADIVLDIFQNVVNIPTERIDLAGITSIKSLYPNRTGTRVISDPIKAFEAVSELAWLLESQVSNSEGKVSLVAEPPVDSQAVEAITSDDIIKNSLSFRRGWKGLKNACLIKTGYSGSGDGAEQFGDGEAFVDQDSIDENGGIAFESFFDKWSMSNESVKAAASAWADATAYVIGDLASSANLDYRCTVAHTSDVHTEVGDRTITADDWIITTAYIIGDIVNHGGKNYKCKLGHVAADTSEPEFGATWATYWDLYNWSNFWVRNEVKARAKALVDRNKNGLRVVTLNVTMRLFKLQPADVVTIESNQLPPDGNNSFKMMVISVNLDWKKGTIKLTLREL